MIPVGTAVGYLTLDYSEFSSNLKTAVGEATSMSGKFSDTLGSGLKTVGNQISSVGKTLTTGLTVPIGTAAAASVKFGAEFDKKMSEVQAVSNATSDEFNQMRDAAISWGEKTVYTATEAGDALYYMGLAGWEPEKSVNALGSVLNLAAAGNLELGRTSDIVTDGMTAMGYQAGELTNGIENTEYYANRLAAAMSNSNTDVNQMGEAMKYVGPLAGSLGYDISDLSVALGLMANAGVKGSQAGTGLRQALKYLITPANDAAAALMDDLGISLFDSSGKALEFRDVLTNLRETFSGTNVDIEEMSNILENEGEEALQNYVDSLDLTMSDQEKLTDIVQIFGTRALPGMLAIINSSDEDFNKLIGAIDGADEAFVQYGEEIMTMQEYNERLSKGLIDTSQSIEILGAAEGMARMQMDNLQGDWTKFTSALGTSKILITDLVKDSLRGFVQKLTELVQWFNNLDEEQKKHILKIAAIVAAIGPLLLGFGKLISGIGSVITGFHNMSVAFTKIGTGITMFVGKIKNVGEAFKLAKAGYTGFASETSALGTALAGVTAPMLAIIAVIAVLVAAFVHLWKTNEDFRNKIIAIWDGIKAKFEEAGQKITDAINSLGFDFSGLGEAIYAAWDWICNALAPIITEIFANIGRIIGGIIDIVTGVVQVICGIIKGFKDGDWSLFIEGLKSIWDGFWSIVTAPFVAVFNVLTEYLAKFGLTWSDVWQGIKDFFVGLWEGIKSFLEGIWNGIVNWFTETINGIVEFWTNVWTNIKTFFENVWNGIKSFFENLWNGIVNFIVGVLTGIVSTITTIHDTINTIFQTVWNAIKTFISNTWDSIKTKISTTFEAIKNFIQTTLQTIQTIKQTIWTAIKNFIANTWDAIKTKISTTFEAIKNFINTTMQAIQTIKQTIWNAIKTFVSNTVDAIKTKISTVFEAIKQTITTIMQAIQTTLQNIWNAIKTFVENTVETIKNTVSQKFEALKSAVTTTVEQLKTNITNKFNEAKTTLVNTAENIKNDISKKFTEMKTAVVNTIGTLKTEAVNKMTEVKNGIVGVFSDIKSKFEEVGSNIISGIKNGISNGWEALKNWVAEKAKSLLDAAKSALGISSPSKEFEKQVGAWLPPGIANGFAKALPAAMSDMENDLDEALNKFDVDDIDVVGLSTTFESVVTDVADWFVSIEERLADTVDNVKQDLAELIGLGNLVLNSDGSISGLVVNSPSDSLQVSTPGRDNSTNGAVTNNFTFYSNESIDEIQAAKLLRQTQRDIAEGFA